MKSSTVPSTKWQHARVLSRYPHWSLAIPCDDAETVGHAFARRAAPHDLPRCAASKLRRLHAAPPPRSASTHPPRPPDEPLLDAPPPDAHA